MGRPLLFLPLLAGYPVVFIATPNLGQIGWEIVALVALASVAVSLMFYVLPVPIGRSAAGTDKAAALVVVMLVVYGWVAQWVDGIAISLRLGDKETSDVLDLVPVSRSAIAVASGLLAMTSARRVSR